MSSNRFADLGISGNTGATEVHIQLVERALGVRFPAEYREFVSTCDEAQLEASVFSYSGGETCVSEFLSLVDAHGPYGVLFHRDVAGPGLVPIARDPGDDLICLDFRTRPPSVTLFDHETGKRIPIASTFGDFMASCHS